MNMTFFYIPNRCDISKSFSSTSDTAPHKAPRQPEATVRVESSWEPISSMRVSLICFLIGSAIFLPAPHKQNRKACSIVSLKSQF